MLRPYDVNTLSIRLYIYMYIYISPYPLPHSVLVPCLLDLVNRPVEIHHSFFWFDFSMVVHDFAVNCELAISEWGFLKKGDPQKHWF